MTEGGALGKAGVRRRGSEASCGVYILFKNGHAPCRPYPALCFWKSRSVLVRVLFMPRTPQLRC